MSEPDAPPPSSSPETGRVGFFRAVTRRRALRWGLGGLGAVTGLVGLGGGFLLSLRGCAPDVEDLHVLGDHQYRTLTQLAQTLLPSGGAFEMGAADVDIARAFDTFLLDEPAQNVRDLTLALHWLEFGPVIHDGRMTTFSNLDEAERLAHWERWTTADDLDRRKASVAFRKFVYLVFYDQPAVWPQIGYVRPPK